MTVISTVVLILQVCVTNAVCYIDIVTGPRLDMQFWGEPHLHAS